jgi:hypothetical protein
MQPHSCVDAVGILSLQGEEDVKIPTGQPSASHIKDRRVAW